MQTKCKLLVVETVPMRGGQDELNKDNHQNREKERHLQILRKGIGFLDKILCSIFFLLT